MLPHGVLEIPTVILTAAYGLWLGVTFAKQNRQRNLVGFGGQVSTRVSPLSRCGKNVRPAEQGSASVTRNTGSASSAGSPEIRTPGRPPGLYCIPLRANPILPRMGYAGKSKGIFVMGSECLRFLPSSVYLEIRPAPPDRLPHIKQAGGSNLHHPVVGTVRQRSSIPLVPPFHPISIRFVLP